jgi:hypothetical protein
MFSEIGFRDEFSRSMEATSTPFIRAGLKRFLSGWLMETASGVVAGGGVVLLDYLLHPRIKSRRAYILNMYEAVISRSKVWQS